MTDAYAAGYSYFLSEKQHKVLLWLTFSFVLHIAIFYLAWWETQREKAPALVYKKAIMVQAVKWGEKPRPKHWMPRKEEALPPPEPEALKVAPNPAFAPQEKKPKAEKKPKTEVRPKETAEQRRKRMAAALSRIRKKVDDDYGDPNGVRGAPSARALQILGSVYAGQLRDIFNGNWAIPSVISEDELKTLNAKILVKIDHAGNIVDYKLNTGSGNSQFDSSAMKAVKLTKQVPLPDEMLQDLVFQQGILINFSWKD